MIFITIIHIFVCLALIMIVLLQTGKGAEMGASFGGGGNQAMIGSSGGATLLSKITTAMAIIFMLTSLSLAYMSTSGLRQQSVTENIPVETTEPSPATVAPATEKAPVTQPATE